MATSRFKTCQFPPKCKRNIKDKGAKEKVYQIFPVIEKKKKALAQMLKRAANSKFLLFAEV
jgi:ABC-type branched-subunit amino acid transport system ATPase component